MDCGAAWQQYEQDVKAYPYCSQVSQPTPSGKQTSPTEATFTWNAVPTATEYRISTSFFSPSSGWGEWGPWNSVGNVTSATVPISAGQTVAFTVIAWCTIDSTQGYATGIAYVDQRAITYTAPSVPSGWVCSFSQEPTTKCQRWQMFPESESRKASKSIRAYLSQEMPLLAATVGRQVPPPEVKASRLARKRLFVEVIADVPQTPSGYPDGRFEPRS